ncbi:HupE/UreJ family protein [Lysobacter enzymogenes]|uniref:HupE/UreJ family protein n=1 Tax=Lysobacter enzymogenes TaxID=69 RepID=UPI00384F65D8
MPRAAASRARSPRCRCSCTPAPPPRTPAPGSAAASAPASHIRSAGGDHLLAMVCVGAWGAQLGAPLRLALPVAFPLMMVAGAALALWGLPMAAVESGIALSVLALGACIACRWRAPVWAACALVAGFALLHGYAHGCELPVAADPAGYSLGFVLATGLLHVLGIGIGELGVRVSGAALRGFGAAVAAVGAGFLYSALSA